MNHRETGTPCCIAATKSRWIDMMGRTGRFLLSGAVAILAAAPAVARDPLGVFEGWGAFRDAAPARCFAIAEPLRRSSAGRWRPFASVAHWPAQRVRGQLHIRLRQVKQRGAPVILTVGERRFVLVAGGADAWAPDPRADAAIIAAIRGGTSMTVETRAENGRVFSDSYALRGAATAIDAAALACARLR